jgi:hypothetical protein
VRASAVRAALPCVVKVGVPVAAVASHGPRDAVLLMPTVQPVVSRKQPVIRLSPAGALAKYDQRGLAAVLGAPAALLIA